MNIKQKAQIALMAKKKMTMPVPPMVPPTPTPTANPMSVAPKKHGGMNPGFAAYLAKKKAAKGGH